MVGFHSGLLNAQNTQIHIENVKKDEMDGKFYNSILNMGIYSFSLLFFLRTCEKPKVLHNSLWEIFS